MKHYELKGSVLSTWTTDKQWVSISLKDIEDYERTGIRKLRMELKNGTTYELDFDIVTLELMLRDLQKLEAVTA